jgi:hypothetical protein
MEWMEKQPELRDVVEAINRYAIANKHNVIFVGSLVAYNPELKSIEDELIIPNKSITFAFGKIAPLRCVLNELRDTIEEEAKDGIVNI